MVRYVLEGDWSGYTSSQRKIVHREVISEARYKKIKDLSGIQYTDGTRLIIDIREAKPREKIVPINNYSSLIRDAEKTGKSYVMISDLR